MFRLGLAALIATVSIVPVRAQANNSAAEFKTVFLKHLQTSEDFTLKVADAMPADGYGFKLTPDQMSFGGQMTHLAEALQYFASAFSAGKPQVSKPAATTKEAVLSYVKASYQTVIVEIQKLSPEQIAKTYSGESGASQTGYDILLGMLDHTTNHRASAEMYLRAKGITPPKYAY